MPRTIPIHALRDTASVARMCSESDDPVFITENGDEEMVIMSVKAYKQKLWLLDAEAAIQEGEADILRGDVMDGKAGLQRLREKYGL